MISDWFKARYDSGDMKNLAQLYTEDCKIMPTGYDVLEGRAGKVGAGVPELTLNSPDYSVL